MRNISKKKDQGRNSRLGKLEKKEVRKGHRGGGLSRAG